MEIIYRDRIKSFTTKDRSEIKQFYHSQNMSLAEAIVEASQTTEYHFHKTSEEIYYVLEGKGLMKIENEEEEVSKDGAIIIPPGKKHRITSIGGSQLRFLCYCSPPYSDEDTILVKKEL